MEFDIKLFVKSGSQEKHYNIASFGFFPSDDLLNCILLEYCKQRGLNSNSVTGIGIYRGYCQHFVSRSGND